MRRKTRLKVKLIIGSNYWKTLMT